MTNATEIESGSIESARLRVENGARWLDENFRGWEERVDPGSLELWNGETCICGQVFEDKAEDSSVESGFAYAMEHLFAQANSWITGLVRMEPVNGGFYATDRAIAVSRALGFNAGDVAGMPGMDNMELLEDAWREELAGRGID